MVVGLLPPLAAFLTPIMSERVLHSQAQPTHS